MDPPLLLLDSTQKNQKIGLPVSDFAQPKWHAKNLLYFRKRFLGAFGGQKGVLGAASVEEG